MKKKTVLLHVCCAPCSISVVDALREEGYEVTGVFFNPNIHPLREYLARRDSMKQLAEKADLPVLWADDGYNLTDWLAMVSDTPQYGARCKLCYTQRLSYTQKLAEEHGFDYFSTSLLYSTKQLHELLAQVGTSVENAQTPFLYKDFRPLWKEGIERAIEEEFYRQSYCGCVYSENERYHKKLEKLL